MDSDFKTYTQDPASGNKPQQLVILLHGLGSNGQDLISLAPYYAGALPDAMFVSPDAPFPCDMAPFGYQWFSLQNREPEYMEYGLERVQPLLDSYLAAQMEKYEVPAEKTALVGFSQGTMTSLYVAPRFPQKLAGVLGYSGALVGDAELGDENTHKMPVHLIHGQMDDVVPFGAMAAAEVALQENGFTVTTMARPALGHSIDEEGIESGAAFLKEILM